MSLMSLKNMPSSFDAGQGRAMSSATTFEERKALALATCFNDKHCHHRLIGHQARTFDFQVKSTEVYICKCAVVLYS